MMSLLQDVARDYQAALAGFGQVFLVSGVLVAFGYWLKARLLRRWRTVAPSRSRGRRQVPKAQRAQAPRRPASFEPSKVAEPIADRVAAEPEAPTSLEAHSQRIAAHVHATIGRGERAVDLHNRALIRLESADYALQCLVLDLAHLISVPQKPEPAFPAVVIGPAAEQAIRLAA